MSRIDYVKFSEVSPESFLSMLNKLKVREHLIEHALFDIDSTTAWMDSKLEVDASEGCKVRAINLDNQLIGWCGIQFEEGKYEIAIVLDERAWGLGIKIFHEIMAWAKIIGHKEVFIHFLHTRPKYKFLQKLAKSVYESELLGHKFNTYQLAVN